MLSHFTGLTGENMEKDGEWYEYRGVGWCAMVLSWSTSRSQLNCWTAVVSLMKSSPGPSYFLFLFDVFFNQFGPHLVAIHGPF